MISPEQFFKCLSDATRLRCTVLLQGREAVCVCDLAEALEVSQPKLSRHLAQLRASGVLSDERRGQWVYYRINPYLSEWQREMLATLVAAVAHDERFAGDRQRLSQACCAAEREPC